MSADWSVLEDPDVRSVVTAVTRSVARQYEDFDADDLSQDCLVIVAEKHAWVRATVIEGGSGLLYFRLRQKLVASFRPELRKKERTYSYDVLVLDQE